VLVCNAGLWPQRHRTTAAGHELAFATNVLGHFVLLRSALPELLAPRARIVMLTGDIYVLVGDCTPEYRFRTPFGGMLAYCRSKLGNHWLALELQRREPELQVAVVHPGVVASELGGRGGALGRWLRKQLSIDLDRGAQASLYAAAAPSLPAGVYLHNTLGPIQLADDDPARDLRGARRLWDQCESFYQALPGRLAEAAEPSRQL
jgi:NAD(P)-dependent dehydrogenase (short-subunit alcohol dehydrogenase family)